MNRITSGITGLDQLIGGGFPEKDLILLSGICGAGKSVFGLQFLYKAAEKEPGIYISFEEGLSQIKDMTQSFGWDVDKYERDDKLRFLKYDPFKLEDIFDIIETNIREIKAKRIVIDSISALGIYVRSAPELRRMILQLSGMLRKNACTSVLISEIVPGKKSLSRFGVEEFVTDGVIILNNFFVSGEYRRGISIWKMRSTDHSRKLHPYKITNEGFVVFPEDTLIR
ncbi:MAG: ATPase domain-containing protein [Candidatus Aenigmatarchaeota archaeon]